MEDIVDAGTGPLKDLTELVQAGMAGDGDWYAFLRGHVRALTDVACPNCGEGRCGCLGVLVPVCAADGEDWCCTVVRAFLAGRMSGLRTAAGQLEQVSGTLSGPLSDPPLSVVGELLRDLLRNLAAALENDSAAINRMVGEAGAPVYSSPVYRAAGGGTS